MYKMLMKYLSAALGLAMLCCCSKMAVAPDGPTVEAKFSVSVDSPQIFINSKAAGDGTLVNTCIMELFYDGQSLGQHTAAVTDRTAYFNVPVVAGRTYSAAFWAQKDGSYDTSSLCNVQYNNDYDPADDGMDAFCARYTDFTVTQESTAMPVTLTRPFAMVSVVLGSGTLNSVGFSAPGSYDVLDDSLGAAENFTYSHSPIYIMTAASMSYIDFTITDSENVVHNAQNIPVQRNRKTNINIQ